MIVAEEGCRFGTPEVMRGLVAGAGGALRLARLIPPARAREILLTGRVFDTAEVWELGLLTQRVSAGDALEAALRLAWTIADKIAPRMPLIPFPAPAGINRWRSPATLDIIHCNLGASIRSCKLLHSRSRLRRLVRRLRRERVRIRSVRIALQSD